MMYLQPANDCGETNGWSLNRSIRGGCALSSPVLLFLRRTLGDEQPLFQRFGHLKAFAEQLLDVAAGRDGDNLFT